MASKPVYLVKRSFVDPCNLCEHAHETACLDCPIKKSEGKVKPEPRYYEGKLVVASGEDAHAFV